MEDERKDLRKLFFDIAHCAIAFNILDNHTEDHHCSTIVRDQETPTADFQLPEPWVGHIEDAPLLFISSNPSIGDDQHAKRSSADEEVWNSHVRLFDPDAGYTENSIYPTQANGSVRKTYVRHWAFVRSRAKELLVRKPIAGIDYALTEIAHCKTQNEIGVRQCAAFCADRYLRRIINISAARLVIAMGFYAHRELRKLFRVPSEQKYAKVSKDLRVIFVPHSNFRGKRTLAAVIPEYLVELREFVGAPQPGHGQLLERH